MYNINIFQLIELALPPNFRKQGIKALFKVLLTPIAWLWADFTNFRAEKAYIMAHNSQVCYLQALLNDKFDYTQRRITISDGSNYDRDYIFTDPEQQPQYLNTLYIELNAEFADSGFDFIVKLNGVLLGANESVQIRNYINIFKLAAKRYIILN